MKPFLPRQLVPNTKAVSGCVISFANTKKVLGGPKFFTPGGTLRGNLISAELYAKTFAPVHVSEQNYYTQNNNYPYLSTAKLER